MSVYIHTDTGYWCESTLCVLVLGSYITAPSTAKYFVNNAYLVCVVIHHYTGVCEVASLQRCVEGVCVLQCLHRKLLALTQPHCGHN